MWASRFPILAIFSILPLIGCSHFQGPGNFKTGSDYPPTKPQVAESTPGDTTATFRLQWPVNVIRITQNFEPARNPRHQGLDLGGPRGTTIMAAHEGRVVYTGHDFHGYGNMVLIEFDDEWATLYAHLRRIRVRQGEYVHAGTTIGTMGKTGHATGVHLHFELMHKKEPIDPLLYLDATRYTAHS